MFVRFLTHRRWPLLLVLALVLSVLLPKLGVVDGYIDYILKLMGIGIILAVSLNLVNGYLGEFSVGHAGFMAVGAYTASLCTVELFPREAGAVLFPLALLAGGAAAAVAGVLLAIPSFRTRGDYLAIVTLAFNMIVISLIQNIDRIGGPRGYMGMGLLTTLPWVVVCVAAALALARGFVYSRFGRQVLAVREDETAAGLVGIDTRHVKLLAFVLSAFLAGIAGGLFAHLVQFVNPGSFTIIKSTEMLVMIYLGGVASLGGSILGGVLLTGALESLRPVLGALHIPPEYRLVVVPLLLVLLMLFRPRGIMGGREFGWFIPRDASGVPPAPAHKPEVPAS